MLTQRNKFKQILIIDGHPSALYEKFVRTMVVLEVNDEKFHIGSTNIKLHKYLRQIPNCNVTVNTVESTRTVKIKDFNGVKVRKYGIDTIIEIAAIDEEDIIEKIEQIKLYLEELNIPMAERCKWVCVIDKEKAKPGQEKVTKQEKTKQLRDMVIKMGIGAEEKGDVDYDKVRESKKESIFVK